MKRMETGLGFGKEEFLGISMYIVVVWLDVLTIVILLGWRGCSSVDRANVS